MNTITIEKNIYMYIVKSDLKLEDWGVSVQ